MYAALDLIHEKQMERVDFSAVPKTYGVGYKLQEICYRAKVEMELFIIGLKLSNPVSVTEAEEYLDILEKRNYWQKILRCINEGRFCPEPPGSIKRTEQTLQNGEKYYRIRSLWDLLHVLNLEDAGENSPKWREVYYLQNTVSYDHWNRSYFDYNERGREFIMAEDVYFVEDIGRWVMVESCYDS